MNVDSRSGPDAVPERGGKIRSNTPPEQPVESAAPRKTFGDATDGASRKDNPAAIDAERASGARRDGDRTDESEVRDEGPPGEPTQSPDVKSDRTRGGTRRGT
jgi:hypothetical protein